MRNASSVVNSRAVVILVFLMLWICGCVPIAAPAAPETGEAAPAPSPAVPVNPFMETDPPPDSDKPLPVPANNRSCWMHSAANMLAAAGYGDGDDETEQAVEIYSEMEAAFGVNNGGWTDAAMQWWLGSSHNTWISNPYSVVTVLGGKGDFPWGNANAAQDMANELRLRNKVGLFIRWPTGTPSGGAGGHALTLWGDENPTGDALANNPAQLAVTDSDTDVDGDVQWYTYDDFTNPNPGGPNDGDGWYFDAYGGEHPFIFGAARLSPTVDAAGNTNAVHVIGSFKIKQTSEEAPSGLHYRVGTDADILSQRTWIDRTGFIDTMDETVPRREFEVVWVLEEEVPQDEWVTISTHFVLPVWNAISYSDVHFIYPSGMAVEPFDLAWLMETPVNEGLFPGEVEYVTGGYVNGGFELYAPDIADDMIAEYRFLHQYVYNQEPERHTLLLSGTRGTDVFVAREVFFDHSYHLPTLEELWQEDRDPMTRIDEEVVLEEDPVAIEVDWAGRLPYPRGLDCLP